MYIKITTPMAGLAWGEQEIDDEDGARLIDAGFAEAAEAPAVETAEHEPRIEKRDA